MKIFIPRVEKSSKISPWEKNLASCGPTALGTTRLPYLKNGPFGNPIFLEDHQMDFISQYIHFLSPRGT